MAQLDASGSAVFVGLAAFDIIIGMTSRCHASYDDRHSKYRNALEAEHGGGKEFLAGD
jgi:hypothetical protein